MSNSLYRQYRPQRFADVVAQEAARDVLTHALENARIGHAYLFSGPRGCGKTSIARILAKALNCLAPLGVEPCGTCVNCMAITSGSSPDVVEIDGASNNSVDEVRQLKSQVPLVPFASKYKIYIIDEVHMLSAAAFNALLKTLEEPPSYVVFILATTEPYKVPVTIRSRCQHIPFHSIGARKIFEHLTHICEWERTAAQPEALWEVARQADGALRDALSMLEQIINRAAGEVTLEDVEAALGAGSRPAVERWLSALKGEGSSSYVDFTKMMEGGSPQHVFEELFSLLKNLWLAVRWPNVTRELDVSEQEKKFLAEEAPRWSAEELRALLRAVADLLVQVRLGVRMDILTGLLMLELSRILDSDRAATRPPQATVSSSPPRPQRLAADPAVEPVEEPAIQKEDQVPVLQPPAQREADRPEGLLEADWKPASKEAFVKLLAAARQADFVLYCALLDADMKQSESSVLLNLRDRYPYEVLCLERWCSGLVELLTGSADGVFLRCGDEVFACTGGEPDRVSEAAVAGRGGASQRPQKEEETLRPAPPEEGAKRPIRPVENGSPKEERLASDLPFDGLVHDLSVLMKGEVVLVRREADEAAREKMEEAGEDDE